jgi:hypothetical protein
MKYPILFLFAGLLVRANASTPAVSTPTDHHIALPKVLAARISSTTSSAPGDFIDVAAGSVGSLILPQTLLDLIHLTVQCQMPRKEPKEGQGDHREDDYSIPWSHGVGAQCDRTRRDAT